MAGFVSAKWGLVPGWSLASRSRGCNYSMSGTSPLWNSVVGAP